MIGSDLLSYVKALFKTVFEQWQPQNYHNVGPGMFKFTDVRTKNKSYFIS